jgi:hypothetical protein
MQIPLIGKDGSPSRVGTVRFHLGDWRRAWWLWPEECALITDPPFGIGYRSHHHTGWSGKRAGAVRSLATHVSGDESTRERDEAMDQPWTVAAAWGPGRLDVTPPWGEPLAVLVHDKGDGVGMGDLSIPWKPNFETIAVYGRGWSGKRTSSVLRGRVLSFGAASASNGRSHPNQKPLEVCAELVGKAPAELVVVDPFAGSGQIPLAAALMGRDAYAAEINEDHYAASVALLRANGVRVIEGPGR